MKNNLKQFLGEMTPEHFLEHYWQKKPLFVKGALSKIDDLASPEDLIEMGLESHFETRMVWEEGANNPWEAKLGPFTKDVFTKNDTDKWTFIAHSLEMYFKEFRALKDIMDFIPSWQFDDIMSTYSVKGASVGAHIDNYNVFICQGKGSRRWQINENPDETYVPDLPIKLLKNFQVEQEFILEPGDMLYLPPGVAHHGVTLEESISYSIGYRSFDYPDMTSAFFTDFIDQYDSSKCLQDKKLTMPKNINEVSDDAIESVMDFFKNEVITKDNIQKWFGNYITAPRDEIVKNEDALTLSDINANLANRLPLYRDNFVRFNFFKKDHGVKLVVNQESYLLSMEDYTVVEKILDTAGYDQINLSDSLSTDVTKVITSLVNQGALYFSSDD